MSACNFRTEFPDFVLDVAIPPEWIDKSWHNDVCPSFSCGSKNLLVWIDYTDPARREFPQARRFTVVTFDEVLDNYSDELFSSDDWTEVLRFIETEKAK